MTAIAPAWTCNSCRSALLRHSRGQLSRARRTIAYSSAERRHASVSPGTDLAHDDAQSGADLGLLSRYSRSRVSTQEAPDAHQQNVATVPARERAAASAASQESSATSQRPPFKADQRVRRPDTGRPGLAASSKADSTPTPLTPQRLLASLEKREAPVKRSRAATQPQRQSRRSASTVLRTPKQIRPNLQATTSADDMSQLIKKRCARALEKQDAAQASRILQSVLEYDMKAHSSARLPTIVYEHLLHLVLVLRLPDSLSKTLKAMDGLGHKCNNKLLTTLLRFATDARDTALIDKIWSMMVNPDVPAWGARVSALVLTNKLEEAIKALDEFKSTSQSSQSAIGIANAAMAAIASKTNKEYEQAIPRILAWMRDMGLEADIYTYNTLVNVAMRRSTDGAFSILARMRERGVAPNSTTSLVLMLGLFKTDLLDGSEAEASSYLMDFLDDVEDKQTGHNMDVKGYATALHHMLAKKKNLTAGQALLQRMEERGIRPNAPVYTILVNFYLDETNPRIPAFQKLWSMLEGAPISDGYEESIPVGGTYKAVTNRFFWDRLLERASAHHAVMGTDIVDQALARMLQRGVRPSWPALQCVARMYLERGDTERLDQFVGDVRFSRGRIAPGYVKPYGQTDFWEFVIQIGILAKHGISDVRQIREYDW